MTLKNHQQSEIQVTTDSHTIDIDTLQVQDFLAHLAAGSHCMAAIERKSESQPSGLLHIYSDPYEVITVTSGSVSSTDATGVVTTSQEQRPLNELQALLSRYKSANVDDKNIRPDFVAGAIGYVGYDCVQYLENISLQPSTTNVPDACFAVFRDVYIFDIEQGTVTLATNSFSKQDLAITQLRLKGMEDRLRHFATPTTTVGTNLPELAKSFDECKFHQQIRKIKQHIRAGDVFQCVLSQHMEYSSSKPLSQVFFDLRATNPSPYHFFFQIHACAVVGASPEPLIKVTGETIQTFPIAGTRPRGQTPDAERRQRRNLKASSKERAEHLMLVDLSRNDLGKVCVPGTVEVSRFMDVQTLSHVIHLVSTVEGQLAPQVSALGALLACFPAGTLTGAPKVRAMQIIAEIEYQRRGLYGGALVLLDFSGNLDSCILIRSLVNDGKTSSIQAGAGIVADSQAAREFAEISHKSAALRQILGGAL